MVKKALLTAAQAVSVDEYTSATLQLLDKEKEDEISTIQQELDELNDDENPNVLQHLRLHEYSSALFGRTMLQLAFPSTSTTKPKPHTFTVGDVVQLRYQHKHDGEKQTWPQGIVARVEDHSISIALNSSEDVEEQELSSQRLTLDRLVNNATYKKMTTALEQLAKHRFGPATSVTNVVFGHAEPSTNPLEELRPFNTNMNASQTSAIQFALATKDIAAIHGPPGTGKTTTVVELIRQLVHTHQQRVLVTAPSNIAVDNVLDKLSSVDASLSLLRIGHPARLLPSIVPFCLDHKVQTSERTEIVSDIKEEIESLLQEARETREKDERRRLRKLVREDRKEVRKREQECVVDLIRRSDVVFATNVGAASKLLRQETFDCVIIDEAAQAVEASCWIPILKGKKCVLAGDHRQLPPTIKSEEAGRLGLELTLFDRLAAMPHTKDKVVRMLDTQYRMHADISTWSSHAMYEDKLLSYEGVASRKLQDLPHVQLPNDEVDLLDATMLLIDTAGCDLEEDVADDSNPMLKQSKSNVGEAKLVASHVKKLLKSGLEQEEIAVITPYNKQVQLLKSFLPKEEFSRLEIRSVDGFQGCEKEAVVMSLVRSNGRKEVGFLKDDRRMNVAITRAKRHVCVVADTDTIRQHAFLKVLADYMEEHGEYRSAMEFLDDMVVHDGVDAAEAVSRVESVGSKSKGQSTLSHNVNTGKKKDKRKTKTVEPKAQEPKATERKKEDKAVESKAAEVEPVEEKALASEDKKEEEEEASPSETQVTNAFGAMAYSSSESEEEKEEEQASNSLLKDLHASRMSRQEVVPAPTPSQKKRNKKKKKGKKQDATPVVDTKQDKESDLDYLSRQVQDSSKCALQTASGRCKKSTEMMGSTCRFCKLRYCMTHAQPEVHGCTHAVRSFERERHVSQSSSETKPLTREKRKQLQKALGDKVSAKSAGRSSKGNKKK